MDSSAQFVYLVPDMVRTQSALIIAQTILIILLCGILVGLLLLPNAPDGIVVGADAAAADAPAAVSAESVKTALQSRPDLIPYRGMLGGTMAFYEASEIYVISDEYVYAKFSDGHVQGSMVLEYQLTDSGDIRWRVLSATLD